MLNITIDPNLKQAWPKATLGCVRCKVVRPNPAEKSCSPKSPGRSLAAEHPQNQGDAKHREQIAQTRACCRALGKDVQRYRNSAEAMHRRILQGKGLYQINNVVNTAT